MPIDPAEARSWFDRWERQQSGVIGVRDERFAVMFTVLDEVFEPDEQLAVLDLASGPAGISMRVLDRYPKARAVAVDYDPVLLAIGKGAHTGYDGRLAWVDHDLRDPSWATAALEAARSVSPGADHFDAVLTSTALHWIPTGALAQVYRACAELLRPGGLLVNCDNLDYPPDAVTVRGVAEELRQRQRAEITARLTESERAAERSSDQGLAEPEPAELESAQLEFEGWDRWWEAVAADPLLAPLHREREERYAWRDRDEYRPGLEVHRALLREAGFCEVETVWQRFQNRVLVAVRSDTGPLTVTHR